MKLQSISDTSPPAKLNELKGLLRKLFYIRRFIPVLAVLTSAFAPLLKKDIKFKGTEEHQATYLKIHNLVINL